MRVESAREVAPSLWSDKPCRFTIGPASMLDCSMLFITTGSPFFLALAM